jgi:hypothetical protein
MAAQSATRRNLSVIQDWNSSLSTAHDESFFRAVRHLETAYLMWSVNLDEALGFRRMGRGSHASDLLGISPALCDRLSHPLLGSLRAMLLHARHFGIAPNLAPLAAYNFQLASSQWAARFNSLFSKLLLTHKSQFQYKLSVLLELVTDLSTSYVQVSGELNGGSSLEENLDWQSLEAAHYDLNTCLRESIVLLKCFLIALPDAQLVEFNLSLRHLMGDTPSGSPVPFQNLAHRRMTLIKGQ